jgi:hypothetical protein
VAIITILMSLIVECLPHVGDAPRPTAVDLLHRRRALAIGMGTLLAS